jgi:hypothetical protein
MDRVALHAKSIEIIHPDTKRKIMFSAPIPDDIGEIIKILESNESL